jgi:surface protein
MKNLFIFALVSVLCIGMASAGGFLCTETCTPCVCCVNDLTAEYEYYDFITDSSGVGNISGFDLGSCSLITTLARTFKGSNFNQDVSGWNTSFITDMSDTFRSTSFNQDISGWDTSQVTTMASMFFNDASFNQDLSSWNISQVTDMSYMFVDSGLSTANYDAILTGWSSQSVQYNVTLDAGTIQYSCAGEVGRDVLTGTYGWSISDGGINETCVVPTPVVESRGVASGSSGGSVEIPVITGSATAPVGAQPNIFTRFWLWFVGLFK